MQESEDSEDAAVVVRRRRKPQLGKDVARLGLVLGPIRVRFTRGSATARFTLQVQTP